MALFRFLPLTLVFAFALSPLGAATRLPSVFSDHMVLQRNQPCPIWGWDEPGQTVEVTFAGQSHTAVADHTGRWELRLKPMAASAAPRTLNVRGSSDLAVDDVLVGEVWLCAGQSNMVWQVYRSHDGDLETLAADRPLVRLLRVPSVGTQELRDNFAGSWQRATPVTVADFSAIGYLFGAQLQEILGVPVGLINNAWGGSAIETWIRRQSLESDPRFAALAAAHREVEAHLKSPAAQNEYQIALSAWETAAAEAQAAGLKPRPKPYTPEWWMQGNKRFGNAFGGSVHPLIGYALRGVIWYQGESNRTHSASYYDLFPFLITEWRREWGQGELPFYWVQLADFDTGEDQAGNSSWAEIREAQTLTQHLPRTGQAVIVDLGEGNNIHPRNKHAVASRLLRLALHHDYGFADLPYRSPEYSRHRIEGSRVLVEFDGFGDSIQTIDRNEVLGFTICGEDRKWHKASARLSGKTQVEVWHPGIPNPVAVRYAWADNPDCNLVSTAGLPVTPFRTDRFPVGGSIYPEKVY